MVFGYACHATVLNDYQWSGDYPGYAQSALERRFEGVQAMFCRSRAGHRPLPRRSVKLAEGYGEELGMAVASTLKGVMSEGVSNLENSIHRNRPAFDSLPSPSELQKEADSDDPYAAARARKWLKVLDEGDACRPLTLTLWECGIWEITSNG